MLTLFIRWNFSQEDKNILTASGDQTVSDNA